MDKTIGHMYAYTANSELKNGLTYGEYLPSYATSLLSYSDWFKHESDKVREQERVEKIKKVLDMIE